MKERITKILIAILLVVSFSALTFLQSCSFDGEDPSLGDIPGEGIASDAENGENADGDKDVTAPEENKSEDKDNTKVPDASSPTDKIEDNKPDTEKSDDDDDTATPDSNGDSEAKPEDSTADKDAAVPDSPDTDAPSAHPDDSTADEPVTPGVPDSTEPSEGEDAPLVGDTIINNNTTVIENNVTVNASGDGIANAASKGLMSAVSIYCQFTGTYISNPWNPTPVTKTYYSTGAGVIYEVDAEGNAFIITNFHVVYDADSDSANKISESIYIYLYGLEYDEYAIPAKFVGGSANYDIALLRVEADSILKNAVENGVAVAADVRNSDTVLAGESVIAIGNPSTDEIGGISVTRGIVSVPSEYITMTASDNSGQVDFRVIRTDTAVNSGNSGGGMFDSAGMLIGIVNAKSIVSGVDNIGYAIPSNVAIAVAENIIDNCHGTEKESVMRVLLGVSISLSNRTTYYDTALAAIIMKEDVVVSAVQSDGIAHGIFREGDIIRSVTAGENKSVVITRAHQFVDALLYARAGETVSFTVERDGEEIELSITVTPESLVAY